MVTPNFHDNYKSSGAILSYKHSRPCTVGLINEYHVSVIPAGVEGRCR